LQMELLHILKFYKFQQVLFCILSKFPQNHPSWGFRFSTEGESCLLIWSL
jgi:hypothetical protein